MLLVAVTGLCAQGYGAESSERTVGFPNLEAIQKAAALGHPQSQFKLGDYFSSRKDYTNAVRWYRGAAELGDVEAQLALAASYREGRGVSKDLNEAERWARLAQTQMGLTQEAPSKPVPSARTISEPSRVEVGGPVGGEPPLAERSSGLDPFPSPPRDVLRGGPRTSEMTPEPDMAELLNPPDSAVRPVSRRIAGISPKVVGMAAPVRERVNLSPGTPTRVSLDDVSESPAKGDTIESELLAYGIVLDRSDDSRRRVTELEAPVPELETVIGDGGDRLRRAAPVRLETGGEH